MVKIPKKRGVDLNAMRARADLKKSDVLDRFAKLIRGPLYSSEEFWAKDFRLLEDGLALEGVNIDLHCTQCGRESVFQSAALSKPINVEIPDSLVGDNSRSKPVDMPSPVQVTIEFLRNLVLFCTRDESHNLFFTMRVSNEFASPGENLAPILFREIQKIGQYPTYADLQRPLVSHLAPYLDDIDRVELNKALGLAAHDSSIAAFVYLRRVFERLIEKEHAKAKKSSGWDENLYQQSRMDEKVKLLSDYLPDILVQNRKIYSVLSVGIHSLTEQMCESVFDPVRTGITIILEDAHSKRQRSDMRENLGPSLDDVQAQIDKALSDAPDDLT